MGIVEIKFRGYLAFLVLLFAFAQIHIPCLLPCIHSAFEQSHTMYSSSALLQQPGSYIHRRTHPCQSPLTTYPDVESYTPPPWHP